jgi:hypothetical protein
MAIISISSLIYDIVHTLCIPSIYSFAHNIGSPEGVTLLEFEAKEGDVQPEVQPEESEEEGTVAELPECPEH